MRLERSLLRLAQSPRPVVLDGPLADGPAFLARVGAFCDAVQARGAKRVGLFLEDRATFAAALLGTWLAGAEVVLPGDVLPTTVQALRGRCDGLLLAPYGDFDWLDQPRSARAGSRGAAVDDARDERAPSVDHHHGEARGASSDTLPPREHAVTRSSLQLPAEARLVVFTSGSTGAPTAIDKTLRQLSAEVDALEATFGERLGPSAVVHATVSHQHLYGLLFTVLWPLAADRRFSSGRLEYPEQFEAALGDRESVLVTSPAHLKRLRDDVRWPLPRTTVFSSGGPLPEEGARRCRAALGQAPIEVFGSTETGGVAWRQRVEGPLPPWAPLPGVSWRVSAERTLEVRSPHLPDDGWLVTSDGVRDEGDGTFSLTGRADRIAKIEEKRVSLSGLERRLMQTGLLAEVRAAVVEGMRVLVGVVAVPSESGRALLEGRGRKALTDSLRSALKDTVELVALPRRFRFVEELPVNAQGKTTEAQVVGLLAPLRPEVRWLERSATRAVLAFEVDPSLKVLDGHFPELAVVPGVAQIDWAIGFACEAFGRAPAVQRLEALKFQALMRPGCTVQLELDTAPGKAAVSFKYVSGAKSFSSGRLVF
jgi:acyl-coenzyme A synthetase/AMP-(fatty) acid ligase